MHNRLFCTDWVSHNWDPILWPALRQHILLDGVAVAIGFAISTRARRSRPTATAGSSDPSIVVTTILYTIPSLALFELLVPRPSA